MSVSKCLVFAGLGLVLSWPALMAGESDKKKDKKEPDQVSYYKHVRPIFQQHCQGCHQPAKAEGEFIMTSHAALFKGGMHHDAGIVPGNADKSAIAQLIVPQKGKPPEMPRGKDPLSDFDVRLIRKWITQGAKDDTPASARVVVDMENPPSYHRAPVITSLAYSPDSSLLAVSGYHEVLVHKSDGSGPMSRLVGLSERIQSIAFSPNGKLMAVSGGAPGRFGEVQIWDVATKQLKLSVPVTFDTVYGVSWSHDGEKLSFGCGDNSLRVIEAKTGKQILYQGGHSDWVLGTVFTRDSLHLVSVSRDRSMKLTEVATQRLIDNVTSITPGALKGGLAAVALRPSEETKKAKVPPDAKGVEPQLYDEVVCGGSDGMPRLYKVHRETKRRIGDDDNKLRAYAALPGRIYAIACNADGSQFVVGSSSDGTGEARVYQIADGKLLAKLEGQRGGVFAVAFRPDGKEIASAGFDGVVRINDPATGKLIREFVPCPLNPQATASTGGK
jgi:WD40 repeat protein/mono/diheme cytochrome c family protein